MESHMFLKEKRYGKNKRQNRVRRKQEKLLYLQRIFQLTNYSDQRCDIVLYHIRRR